MNKFYVTTPIYYINDKPHIGHAYTTIAADVLARYHRQKGDKVRFLTGTDENSRKTVEAAKEAGKEIKQYTDEMAKQWQETWDALGLTYDRFIRTTEPDHVKAVQDIIQRIYDAGDIYKGVYEGLYCFRCEQFYKEDELVEGKCPIHKVKLEHIKEDNYFFKLSKYGDELLKRIKDDPDVIRPQARHNEVVAFIERGLEDISVSRASQEWGIRLPFDQSQVIYVWFDALINYVTGSGYPDKDYTEWWPADLHLVGKDIIKFHCIIWPAMLLSAGIEPAKSVFANGFFTVDGEKISKSSGNAIDPIAIRDEYGNDALRYYLLSEIPYGNDGDFSHERLAIRYDTNLANNLGNLVQRISTLIERNLDGEIDQVKSRVKLDQIEKAIHDVAFHTALSAIWAELSKLNEEIEQQKPWELAKNDSEKLKVFLSQQAADILEINRELKPFLPETAEKIQAIFSAEKIESPGHTLFPRKDLAK